MQKNKSESFFVIFSLWLLVFASSSQIMIIAPILPQIGKELGTPTEMLGMLITVYAVMVGLFAIIMGPFSDKIGRRKVLILGSGAMTVFLFLHGFVFDYYSFLIVRALAGVAGGILSGAAVAYVGDYFPYEKRGWANGWIMSGIAVGQILGIPIGTFLTEAYHFKTPFLVFAVLMAFTFIVILIKVPQPNVELHNNKLTILNSLEKYLLLLKRKDVAFVAFSYFLMFLSLSVFIIYLPTWLEDSFTTSLTTIGYIFAAGGVANVIAGPSAGWLSDKIGRKNIIITSCIGLSLLMYSTTFFVTKIEYAFLLFPVAMILVAMRISPFQALSSELVQAKNRGTLMSLLIAIGQIGYGLGGSVAGPLYATSGYRSNTYFGAVAILLMAYIVWKYVPEPKFKTETALEA
ncbi:MAG: MFS transporter [Balneolaceae bacterium]